MSVTASPFLARLAASGLATPSEATAWIAEAGACGQSEQGALADELLAEELVRRQRLTRFQAESLLLQRDFPLVLGRYVLLDRIGEGGMGQVFKARHVRLERLVAIKLLHEHAFESPEAVRRFHLEVKTAGRLRHPNIVLAYDADEIDGRHYLVMEFVDGRDLGAVAQDQPPAVAQAAGWIVQAARGLAHAHEAGIVHRDIKPSNLLLDQQGVVKVLDMGIARMNTAPVPGDVSTATQLTQSGVILGTVDFMAPEQAVNLSQADARSDIYSLGCSLYQLLSGRPAFEGATLIEKIIAHREREFPCLQDARPDVPLAFEAALERMVAKQPGDRFQHMGEVVEALLPFADADSYSVPPPPAERTSAIRLPTEKFSPPPTRASLPAQGAAPSPPDREQLERVIDGCGAVDCFVAIEEENHIFRLAGERGFSLEQIEACLAEICRKRDWTRQSELTKVLTQRLVEAASGGAIDRREFEEIVTFAVGRKMPRRAAQEHCLTLILDSRWPVKEGLFDKWFSRLCRQYGLS